MDGWMVLNFCLFRKESVLFDFFVFCNQVFNTLFVRPTTYFKSSWQDCLHLYNVENCGACDNVTSLQYSCTV